MQTVELVPSSPDPGGSIDPGSPWQDPSQLPQTSERFDAVIGRALSRSSRGASDDSSTATEFPRAKEKTRQPGRDDSTHSAQAAGADNSTAPSAPASQSPKPASQSRPAADPVAGPGQAADSGSTVPTASKTSGDSPAAAAPPQAPQPKAAVPANESGSGADVAKALAEGNGQDAGSQSSPAEIPGAGNAAGLENRGIDPAAKTVGIATILLPATAASSGVETGGISSAQQPVPMQKAEKMNEFPASAEQNVPVPPAGVAGEELPVKTVKSMNSAARADKSEPVSTLSSTGAGPAASDNTLSSVAQTAQAASSTSLRSLERTQDLMSLHAFRLRDSGADSLQVVIKPGPGMQLSLNLQMRDGHVEMRATLHRGDFNFMNGHWSELQQQLGARGVRLAPLTSGEQAGPGDKGSFQQPARQQNEQDSVPAGAFAEFALAGALKSTPSTTTPTRTLRGWESWA